MKMGFKEKLINQPPIMTGKAKISSELKYAPHRKSASNLPATRKTMQPTRTVTSFVLASSNDNNFALNSNSPLATDCRNSMVL